MARRKLGDTLVGWGVITPQQLEAALEAQARDGRTVRRRLGRVLVDAGLVTDGAVAAALADMHGLQVVDLDLQIIDPGVARRIPHSIAVQHVVLPLTVREGVLRVAVADPVDVVALDDLRMRAQGLRLEVVVAAESQLRDKIAELWSQVVTEDALEKFVSELSVDEEVNLEAGDDEGAVAAVHQILSAAVRAGASDVHIEPMRDGVRVRVRIDGTLRPLMSLPRSGHSSIVARTKIVSGLDIVERRVPQDGRARLRVDGRDRNLRVSTLPTMHGEKIVVRLLSDQASLPSLTDLGMGLDQELILQNALHLPQGLVLITGPTGSGKSTTLYAAIRQMVNDERNLITLEDPVEIELPGVAQVQVSDKTGMTFAAGLRSALRQDPDVIMVGEIRDQITAELAVRAALTGHLVLSTLHTNDSASAVIRLVEMGVPNYLVASSLTLSMAQRLVRKPCPECVVRSPADADTRRRLGMTDIGGGGVRGSGGLPVVRDVGVLRADRALRDAADHAGRAGGADGRCGRDGDRVSGRCPRGSGPCSGWGSRRPSRG